MAMCTDHMCAACQAVNTPFLNGGCLTVPGAVTPTNAFPKVAINCSALAGEAAIVPMEGTAVSVSYHADADCVISPTTYRTEFTTVSGACNPISETTSMSVTCEGDTGIYSVYGASAACDGASDDTPFFGAGQCLPQRTGHGRHPLRTAHWCASGLRRVGSTPAGSAPALVWAWPLPSELVQRQ